MRDEGKRNLLGVLVDVVDYEGAVRRIVAAARENREMAVTALAAHGVMTGVLDREHRYRLNHFDLATPDGQGVRWALNIVHRAQMKDRVYGPRLTLDVCRAAQSHGLPVFFYGSRRPVIDRLVVRLAERFPGLPIAGAEPSAFRQLCREEKQALVARIRASGARIAFVGLGCPRQEVFAYEYHAALGMPVVAVGAAFDYHAGVLAEPPAVIQAAGLQWLMRFVQEPRRLWKRYTVYNIAFVVMVAMQASGILRPDPSGTEPVREMLYG